MSLLVNYETFDTLLKACQVRPETFGVLAHMLSKTIKGQVENVIFQFQFLPLSLSLSLSLSFAARVRLLCCFLSVFIVFYSIAAARRGRQKKSEVAFKGRASIRSLLSRLYQSYHPPFSRLAVDNAARDQAKEEYSSYAKPSKENI